MADPTIVRVRVKGRQACFTQTPHKVERFSSPVCTPSAARGILESIYWHPQIAWLIREIQVLSPIRYADALLRNEVKSRFSFSKAEQQVKGTGLGYFADLDRTQRSTVGLLDVDYIIVAQCAPREDGLDLNKYTGIFRKRVDVGQVYKQPCLGLREFVAWVYPVRGDEQPIAVSRNLGSMLFDLSFDPADQGRGTPLFFEAELQKGILHVPMENYYRISGLAEAARRVTAAPLPRLPAFPPAPSRRRTRDRRQESTYRTLAAVLAVARARSGQGDPTERFLWTRLYAHALGEQDTARVVSWVRDRIREQERGPSGTRPDADRRRRRVELYQEMLTVMREEG